MPGAARAPRTPVRASYGSSESRSTAFNDTFGHGIGDEVLAAVGVALQSTVRENDFVGRYGGEEFIMLLDADRETTLQVGRARPHGDRGDRRPRGRVGRHRELRRRRLPGGRPRRGSARQERDRALYRAKANGRNRVEMFTLDAAPEGEPSPGTTASATPASS